MQIDKALDKVYNSRTYDNLQNEDTGLYIQSPEYVYEELMHEIRNQKSQEQ